jgi:hypothetical protein
VVFSLAFFHVRALPDLLLPSPYRSAAGFEAPGPGAVRHPRPPGRRARLLPGQYNALDALVEALRSPDWWLLYQAEALLDQPPEQDAQAAEDVSAVERVKTALVERDDELHRAQEDLAGVRTIAAAWEAEVASARVQPQQDREALEGARAWQSQAEEMAKEAEGLRTTLADKAAALAAAEEQLRRRAGAGCPRRGPGCARAGTFGAGGGVGSAPAGAHHARGGASDPQAAGGRGLEAQRGVGPAQRLTGGCAPVPRGAGDHRSQPAAGGRGRAPGPRGGEEESRR